MYAYLQNIRFLATIYIPEASKPTEITPPIIVEIQQIVDISFLKRLTRYCLNIHDEYKFFPVVIVFAIKGFSSKAFMYEFKLEKDCPYHTTHGQFWAQSIQVYSLDSISSFVTTESAMKPIVALSYFLSSRQKSIVTLDEFEDEELRKIYSVLQLKIAVCDVTDIVECVGLVTFSSTQNKYKVIWPYPCFYKKLDNKLDGKLNDI
ncbi:hypothetical protein BD770DRAFT_471027 [Pilaira anomala]|nr:hypothetical protein BD770DRAFT_471027 [Pilaira anomala]